MFEVFCRGPVYKKLWKNVVFLMYHSEMFTVFSIIFRVFYIINIFKLYFCKIPQQRPSGWLKQQTCGLIFSLWSFFYFTDGLEVIISVTVSVAVLLLFLIALILIYKRKNVRSFKIFFYFIKLMVFGNSELNQI